MICESRKVQMESMWKWNSRKWDIVERFDFCLYMPQIHALLKKNNNLLTGTLPSWILRAQAQAQALGEANISHFHPKGGLSIENSPLSSGILCHKGTTFKAWKWISLLHYYHCQKSFTPFSFSFIGELII